DPTGWCLRRKCNHEGHEEHEGKHEDTFGGCPNDWLRACLRDLRVLRGCIYLHDRFTNSQRKKGPPIKAVTTPTGISSGDISVRAARSHNTRNAAPNNAEAGSTIR